MTTLDHQIAALARVFEEGEKTGLTFEAWEVRKFRPLFAAMKERARALEAGQPAPVGLDEPFPTLGIGFYQGVN